MRVLAHANLKHGWNMDLGSLERFAEMLSELIVRAIDLNKIVGDIYFEYIFIITWT